MSIPCPRESISDRRSFVKNTDRVYTIEYIVYDDATDVGTMVRLTEKLILEDQVDILFSLPVWHLRLAI